MSKKKKEIESYQAALTELQSIVEEFQDELVDVDQLADKAKRAAELIRYCQEKLRRTQKDLDQLFE